jgi:ABC-type transport system involved in resistance to organic solvents, permease component
MRGNCPEDYNISFTLKDLNLFINLSGQFSLQNLMVFRSNIKSEISKHKLKSVTIDFSEVCYLDSAAALAFVQIEKEVASQNIQCQLINLNNKSKGIFNVIHDDALLSLPFKFEKSQDGFMYNLIERRKLPSESEKSQDGFIFRLVERRGLPPQSKKSHRDFIWQIGQSSMQFATDFVNFITFIGELLVAFFILSDILKNFGERRSFYIHRAGVDGLPIVAMIGLLVGLIIAFMSFLQFKMVGANIYVPSLVSFAMIKELGPLMTAILVAGRSGSAYAAEIGTMMVNEEVDALHTMGFEPIRFLAMPKVIATVIVVPILTVYADLFGVVGGMIIGITSLDLTIKTYVTQSMKTIQVFDIVTSLIKAAVFAGLISAIGCQRGFQVRSGAQDVGKFTTSAVVVAIFMIVVADSIFAIMFYYIK